MSDRKWKEDLICWYNKTIEDTIKESLEEAAKVAESYRSPYTLKGSENSLSSEEITMQEYVRERIAEAIRKLKESK